MTDHLGQSGADETEMERQARLLEEAALRQQQADTAAFSIHKVVPPVPPLARTDQHTPRGLSGGPADR